MIIKKPIPNNIEIEGIDLTIQYDPEVFELIGYNNENSSLDNSVYSTIINENSLYLDNHISTIKFEF